VGLGWGVGVAPELQVREAVAAGQLVGVLPEVSVDVTLYWHQWKLGPERTGAPSALLDQVGLALAAGARVALGA
jgi:LysR family transcriptional regulator (chromosome initiation inhibitor)